MSSCWAFVLIQSVGSMVYIRLGSGMGGLCWPGHLGEVAKHSQSLLGNGGESYSISIFHILFSIFYVWPIPLIWISPRSGSFMLSVAAKGSFHKLTGAHCLG